MRPTGALRDEPGTARGQPIQRLVSATRATLPDAFDLRGPWTEYRDQGASNACQGFARAQAIRTVSKGRIKPSAKALYAVARQLEGGYVARLADIGAYTHKIVEASSGFGLVSEDRWPDSSDPTERVTQDVIEAGSLAVDTADYRVWDQGEALQHTIRRVVSSGYPMTYAQDVDAAYMRLRGPGVWGGLSGDVAGAHAQCIVAYRPDAVGVAGSWGTDWADDGLAWIAWSFFAGPNVYDVQVVTAAPRGVW